MSVPYLLNTAWMLKCLPEARAFRRATRQLAATQTTLLLSMVRANQHTAFGQAHRFDKIATIADFQQRVPLCTYKDVAPWIERIAAGERSVLTSEPVTLLQPTSGTTDGEKWIPYTAGLRAQFQRGVAAWIADLFRRVPAVRGGRAYWSISPMFGAARVTPAGTPIGFADDASYLGTVERRLLDRLLVSPAASARIGSMTAFRYATLLSLLRAADLSLISIWNPTFLTALFAPLRDWQERLTTDVRNGTFTPPTAETSAVARAFQARPDPRRADQLCSAFRISLLADAFQELWPRLALISCWTDAAAAFGLPDLRALFPLTPLQPKGLLATEGCVSFPLVGRAGAVLAARSHFVEFATPEGDIHLAHELQLAGRYRVILTTGGGLYRYQLRDEIEVVGFENATPLLRFRGKADRISDLVGEKLAEAHVSGIFEELFRVYRLAPRFALLAPVLGQPAHYRLFIQSDDAANWHPRLRDLAEALELRLAGNPHYRYAVELGQLGPVDIQLLEASPAAWNIYHEHCLRRGQRAGDIKPAALDAWTGWPELLRPAGHRGTSLAGASG